MTSSASATISSPIDATACARASVRPPAPERHLESQPIAGHHLQPELRVVHASQPGVRRTAPRPASSSVATCASVSIMSTPGISGVPGKCPWKNLR